MYQTYYLLKFSELKQKKFFGNVLKKPIRLDTFAVQTYGSKGSKLIDNPEMCYFKYSLDKKKLANEKLDLKVDCDEKLEIDEDTLQIHGELDTFLEQILKNRDRYLLRQPGSSLASDPPVQPDAEPLGNLSRNLSEMRLSSGRTESGRKLLATDFVALRATLAVLM